MACACWEGEALITFSIGVVHKGQGFRLVPPLHAYFADPFILDVSGDVVEIVFERYNRFRRKADIQWLSVDFAAGTTKRASLIDEPHHLSYPFVIRHEGRVYLMPESCGAAVQRVYRLDREGGRCVARPICTVPARHVDPTVVCLSAEGDGILRYYTGGSNHDGELRECRIHFSDDALRFDGLSRHAGMHRPGGWWNDEVYPVQQAGTRYGFGLTFTDISGKLLPPPSALPASIVDDLGHMHHLSQHGGAITFDVCSDVGVATLFSRSRFFKVE